LGRNGGGTRVGRDFRQNIARHFELFFLLFMRAVNGRGAPLAAGK
jgi:hypothetical protein